MLCYGPGVYKMPRGFQVCSAHGVEYPDYGDCSVCIDERDARDSRDRMEALQRESIELQRRALAQKPESPSELHRLRRAAEHAVDRQLLRQLLDLKGEGKPTDKLIEIFDSEDFQSQRDGFVKELINKKLEEF